MTWFRDLFLNNDETVLSGKDNVEHIHINTLDGIENDKWIRIWIEVHISKEQVSKIMSVIEDYARELGWEIYSEKIDLSNYEFKGDFKKQGISDKDFKKARDNMKNKEYFAVGIEPKNGGTISPRELGKMLLEYRKVALSLFNCNSNKSEVSSGSFDWRIEANPKDLSNFIFRVYKPCIEIKAELRKAIRLCKQNPALFKKSFYFSLKEIYSDYSKLSKSKDPTEAEQARVILDILDNNGMNTE